MKFRLALLIRTIKKNWHKAALVQAEDSIVKGNVYMYCNKCSGKSKTFHIVKLAEYSKPGGNSMYQSNGIINFELPL